MNTLVQLRSLLPAEWPTQKNSDPAWWAKHWKQIKVEDYLAQAQLDLFFQRDAAKTGSALTIRRLEVIDVASDNHKSARDTALLLRDGNPGPLLKRLRVELAQGFMGKEMYARYFGFRIRDCWLALLYLANRPSLTKDHRALRGVILLWLGAALWWLEHCELDGQPYSCGTRKEYIDEVDGDRLALLRGQRIDLNQRRFGHSPGSMMNGGMPRATDCYFGQSCNEAGLMKGIEASPPVESLPTRVERPDGGVLSYFTRLRDRPGGGPILAAVEMHRGWNRPRLWVVTDSHSVLPPLEERGENVYIPAPPARTWKFDSKARSMEAA